MEAKRLEDLLSIAMQADGPTVPPAELPSLGGVDPLGLRQLNFDLMDLVLPGLNNVARHIRPFVVVAWACRRARRIAEERGGQTVSEEEYCGFVDRVEVIYAWSLFLKDPNADLPGRQVLTELVRLPSYHFGGGTWKSDERIDATQLHLRRLSHMAQPSNHSAG